MVFEVLKKLEIYDADKHYPAACRLFIFWPHLGIRMGTVGVEENHFCSTQIPMLPIHAMYMPPILQLRKYTKKARKVILIANRVT